jgi:hypothetical protein
MTQSLLPATDAWGLSKVRTDSALSPVMNLKSDLEDALSATLITDMECRRPSHFLFLNVLVSPTHAHISLFLFFGRGGNKPFAFSTK